MDICGHAVSAWSAQKISPASCQKVILSPTAHLTHGIHVGFEWGPAKGLSTILMIFMSYPYIIISILKIQSFKSRYKDFSTCVSHLIAVMVFYGIAFLMCLQPSSKYPVNQDKIICFLSLGKPCSESFDLQPEEERDERGFQKDCTKEVFFSLNWNVGSGFPGVYRFDCIKIDINIFERIMYVNCFQKRASRSQFLSSSLFVLNLTSRWF